MFDLLIVPAMLWRRSRPFALLAAVGFHLFNASVFNIDIFPWMMIAANTLFCAPQWPRRLLEGDTTVAGEQTKGVTRYIVHSRLGRMCVAAYIVIQLLMPLRHLVYKGDVAWTEEGHRFSWRMMLNAKSGHVRYRVVSAGDTIVLDADDFLSKRQKSPFARHPDMILQLAHHIAARYRDKDTVPEVYAIAFMSLNGRPHYPLVDSTVDLASVRRSLLHAPWVTLGPGANH
jgi:hypothetical protein